MGCSLMSRLYVFAVYALSADSKLDWAETHAALEVDAVTKLAEAVSLARSENFFFGMIELFQSRIMCLIGSNNWAHPPFVCSELN